MENIFWKRLCFLCWLLLTASGVLRAQFEEGQSSSQLNSISCSQALPSVPNTVTYTAQGEASRKIKNIVRLKINELALNGAAGSPFLFFKSGFSATATLKVELWNLAANGGNAPDVTLTPSLTVTYDTATGTKYKPIAYILLNPTGTYEQVRVTINTVAVSGLNTAWTPTNVLPLLTVESEMDILRYFTLAGTSSLLLPSGFTSSYDAVNHPDQLNVGWTMPTGTNNNLCQLEYAWVENEARGFYNVSGVFDPNTLFRLNSTRIDIDFNGSNSYNYNIPLLFPADPTGAGALYYRVRAVLKKNDGNLIVGPWSSPLAYAANGHQPNMNWQLSTDFAENGKSKTIVQYYDGSLRPRQTVAKDNSTGNTTVSETIYDLQGRPNVQILPTPTLSTAVQYFSDFNRFAGQSTNDDPAKYFDLAVAGNQCVGAPALDKTRGSGQYYSSNNPWIATEPTAKFIPDANGYDYTETRYTDDPTGRVSRQGGVGQSHQIGSGHEGKFFYGKPTQNELDALFGTEAGDASHYFKHMVQDANGQMSVKYVDLHGHMVATALAGAAPANIGTINNNAAFYPVSSGKLTNNLLTPATNMVKGNSIESISTVLVPSPTLYTFTYQLNPAILQQMSCNSQQICFDCKYNLEISIRSEDCSAAPIIKHYNNLQLQTAALACSTPMGFTGDSVATPTTNISFPVTLGTGSWIIRKTLTLNDSLLKVREDSALVAFLCRTQQNIQDSVFAAMSASSNCSTPAVTRNCSTCQAQLGTYANYKSNYIASVGGTTTLTDAAIHALYTQDSLDCADACGTSLNPAMSTLGVLRNQMLSDMIPYNGQYAIPGVATTTLTSKYNIFDASSSFGNIGTRPYYKNPVSEPSGAATSYTNSDGTIDSTIYGQLSGISADDYTAKFSRSWASQLIYYHPEYSKLHFAETTLASSYAFLDAMLQCTTYAQASSKGYLTPLTSDPYFSFNSNAGYVPADRNAMSGYLTSKVNPSDTGHTSIWQIANGIALTDTTLPQSLRANFMYGVSYTGLDASATTTAQQDAVWQAFRNEYMYYRNEMVVKYINAQQAGTLSQANMNQLISEQKQLHFVTAQDNANQNGWTYWATATSYSSVNPTTLAAQAQVYENANFVDPCQGERPFWQGKLMQCEQLQQFLLNQTHSDSVKVTTIINAILDSLVQVCYASFDYRDPAGATNVNPIYLPTNPNNFEDVINHVFTQYGISTLPANNYFCNPYSVDYPKPYNLNVPIFVNRSANVDTCNCAQFALVKSAAKVAGYDTTSLSSMNAYLLANYNDTLSTLLWQALLKCSGYNFNHDTCLVRKGSGGGGGGALVVKAASVNKTGGSSMVVMPLASVGADSCITFYKPIGIGSLAVIPSFLSCGYVRPCVTCAVLQTNTLAFRSLYPAYAGVPYTGAIDTNMARQNALWARYLNYKTGINKTASDYAAAYVSCNFSTSPSYLLLTNRSTQPPSGSQLPMLYTASDSIVFYQEYTSLDTDNFETLIAGYSSSSGYALCDLSRPVTAFVPLPDTTHSNPCAGVQEQANFIGLLIFQQRKDSLIANFDSLYKAKCLGAQSTEVFYATYQPSEYHYTLYYYDQAGNLLKTLPPAAVKPNFNATYLAQVQSARAAYTDLSNGTNIENMATQLRYNSLNEVIAQRTPDAGISLFWYDRLGRRVVSQDAKQAVSPASYSYTLYDILGRITEVGQKPQNTAMKQTISQDTTALKSWLSDLTNGGTKVQITRTVYDMGYPGFTGVAPIKGLNLRNRLSYTQVIDVDNTNPTPYRAATFYSYDIHGNLDSLVQDYGTASVMSSNGNRFKLIKYDYDLISGKIRQIRYQPGSADAFYHQYTYDAENRIIGVRTSKDSAHWQNDASYKYYRHGPLARTQLGDLLVQGVDYAYTLQGLLKSANPSWINAGSAGDLYDSDGVASNNSFERDAYKFNLNYYDDGTYTDYKPISPPTGYVQGNTLPSASRFNLYDGNISSMAVSIRKLAAGTGYSGPLLYNYKFDQLSRIMTMDAWAANGSFGATGSSPLQDYAERYGYDPNGNIMNLVRHGNSASSIVMDSMTYNYSYVKTDGTRGEYIPSAVPTSGVDHLTNQLSSIGDVASSGYDDIKNQSAQNYQYDPIGNLTSDVQAGITAITWSVYGKILTIANASGVITYTYDASGNRISKNAGSITTFYVRDALGNVMATYVQGDNTKNAGALTQTELPVYGSSRLGILNLNVNCTSLTPPSSDVITRGNKLFELTNHLGNVLVTVTDKKLQHSADGTNIDYYRADVATAADYYPFGMPMPGRTFSSASYRYGYNGKEQDNEVKGTGDQINYGLRVYDPRVGKFLSVDPLTGSYPWFTPYQYAGNKPVSSVDIDGGEDRHYIFTWTKDNVVIGITSWNEGNVIGSDKNGVEVYDRPERIIAHYPVFVHDELYYVTAVYNTYDDYKKAKASDFTWSTINLGMLLGARDGSDLATKAEMAMTGLAVGVSLKDFLKDRINALAKQGIKDAITLEEKKLIEGVEREVLFDGLTKTERIAKSASRPSFRKGVIEKVWNEAKDAAGKVFDPNTGEELTWDKFKSRFEQWHMGHVPESEYRVLRQEYIEGKKTWQEVLDEYNDPTRYRPEHPKANMSHKYEAKQ